LPRVGARHVIVRPFARTTPGGNSFAALQIESHDLRAGRLQGWPSVRDEAFDLVAGTVDLVTITK
jgi:hypothetical protein